MAEESGSAATPAAAAAFPAAFYWPGRMTSLLIRKSAVPEQINRIKTALRSGSGVVLRALGDPPQPSGFQHQRFQFNRELSGRSHGVQLRPGCPGHQPLPDPVSLVRCATCGTPYE